MEFLYPFGYLSLVPAATLAVLNHQVVHTLPQVPSTLSRLLWSEMTLLEHLSAVSAKLKVADGRNGSHLGRAQCLDTKKERPQQMTGN